MQHRIEKLMEILARKGYQSVSELSRDLNVSEMTVRRYLDRLEQRNLIRRTHGGAYTGQEMIEVDYRVRETVCRAEKEAIGRLAASIVEPGESVFIDAGSTCAFMALSLDDTKRITVVTNSLVVAATLENKASIDTILLGGTLHAATHSLIGSIPEEIIKRFKFNKVFLGASGASLREGLTQSTLEEIPVKRIAASNTKEVIVLVDSSKFHKDVLVLFFGWESVHTVVTDPAIRHTDRQVLEERGIRVLVADRVAAGSPA